MVAPDWSGLAFYITALIVDCGLVFAVVYFAALFSGFIQETWS
jgi:hypothetical protein